MNYVVTVADRAAAGVRLKLMKKPNGPTPPRRVSWMFGPTDPVTDEDVSPPDMRQLAKYARYRASEKGRARTERYNNGPAGQVANFREYMKKLRERCDSGRTR